MFVSESENEEQQEQGGEIIIDADENRLDRLLLTLVGMQLWKKQLQLRNNSFSPSLDSDLIVLLDYHRVITTIFID